MELHTIYELMPVLEVDYQTIWYAVTKGYVAPFKRVGRVWLFDAGNVETLKQYVAEKKAKRAMNVDRNARRKFKKAQ